MSAYVPTFTVKLSDVEHAFVKIQSPYGDDNQLIYLFGNVLDWHLSLTIDTHRVSVIPIGYQWIMTLKRGEKMTRIWMDVTEPHDKTFIDAICADTDFEHIVIHNVAKENSTPAALTSGKYVVLQSKNCPCGNKRCNRATFYTHATDQNSVENDSKRVVGFANSDEEALELIYRQDFH